MPRHKESEREAIASDTAQRLLASATQEFARVGYARANINAISAAAGYAKGTIYNYYSSKRDLMLTVIDQVGLLHLAIVEAEVMQQEHPKDRLERFFRTGPAFATEHAAGARVLISAVYGADQEFREHAYMAYQPMFRFVAQHIVSAGMAQGVFRDVELEATVRLLMTMYLMIASHRSLGGDLWLQPPFVAEFAWQGLRA